MTIISLILRNLKYYRKSYLSILAGTVISTAVLTGALVVGDSVRYSLEHLSDIRLGKIRFAIQSGDRFFRQQLATELAEQTKSAVAPVLQLEGIAVNTDQNTQINKVEVLGINDQFLKLWNTAIQQPGEDEAILSRNTAEKLNLETGDEFLLKLHKKAKASENAPFVSEKEPLVSFRLKVTAIANDNEMGRFSLKSNQSAPFNIFISLKSMARKVALEGSANLLLITGNEEKSQTARELDSLIRICWKPADAGLTIGTLDGNNLHEIKSDRIFIDDNTAKAFQTVIPNAEPIFTYLVNAISIKGKSTPYSFVTATNKSDSQNQLSRNEIIISSWLATDLAVKPGDSLQLRYFKMGDLRKLTEDSSYFCVKTILPITDPIFDRTLMPDFPGMSDAGNCRDWETGAPVDLNKIRDKDEQYWNTYRGMPKAIISLAAGQQIWDNAFGHATAFRFEVDSAGLKALTKQIMDKLLPDGNGLKIQNIYAEGKKAAANSTDFGGLFLSLSFFILAAALLLTTLLFSLHAQKRMAETAIMATLGFRKKEIISVLIIEAAFVVVAGSILGSVCGIFYNKLMLLGLNTLWQDAVRTSMLQMHLAPKTLVIGFVAGMITALIALFWVLMRHFRKPISVMVKGVEITSLQVRKGWKNFSMTLAFFFFGIVLTIAIYAFFTPRVEFSGFSLPAGGMILSGGIALVYAILLNAGSKISGSVPGIYTIILRNVSLKKRRTVTVIALLAIGTFTVIITGANRKSFYGTENTRQSGTGGFLLWAESTVPVMYDLNSPEGKQKYGLTDEKELKDVRFAQMLNLDGNDASCLNLNQVSQPKILGINPQFMDQQQSFSFVNLEPSVNSKHPWLAINQQLAPGIIPSFADQTVITWGLQKKIGDTLLYTDESGKILKLVLIGGLGSSVFQGNILVSGKLFSQYFPSAAGSRTMLVDGEFARRSQIAQRLEYLFQDYGMIATPTSQRLAEFNSVSNTYLSVFMLLSGLGIIIGTIGLGIVLLQNLAERKKEIALYKAIGFKNKYIRKLIFTENLLILLTGMGIGIVSAFTGILPSFFSSTFQLPTTFILVILLLILLSGFVWIYFPVKSALKKNLVQALRKE
ncbi:MAG: ABC transporter permease [Lentimicrobiaceae bacterium]|jgi:ABC-type antimicrobial peptide transport system permease subunit